MQEISGKPDIQYPTNWGYKVIGLSEESVRTAVDEVLENREYKLSFSNKSSKGKFISLNISITVNSEVERDSIFKNLKNHAIIKMVI